MYMACEDDRGEEGYQFRDLYIKRISSVGCKHYEKEFDIYGYNPNTMHSHLSDIH